MLTLKSMLFRNVKLFFKDKGLFFTSLITPLILLVLYTTFLGNVYKDAFNMTITPLGYSATEKVVNGFSGAQLFSSLLAVSPITVPFCANMLMVQDKVSGARRDFLTTPLSKKTLALSYYLATLIVSLIICFFAVVVCFIYIGVVGWFFNFLDVLLILLDVIILVLFGTALSSLINGFLSSQGQISAVGSIVSSGYGFISGAYMPISSFSGWLRNLVAFLPGTYGTSLIRTHALGGVLRELKATGIPSEVTKEIADSVDCTIYFFDSAVPLWASYLIIGLSIVLAVGIFVLIKSRRSKTQK